METITKTRVSKPIVAMRSRPLGQRELIKNKNTVFKLKQAGFKEITKQQMTERFCCEQIEQAERQKRRQKWGKLPFWSWEKFNGFHTVWSVLAGGFCITCFICAIINLPDLEATITGGVLLLTIIFAHRIGVSVLKYFYINEPCCEVTWESLDTYKEDIVPDRCYSSLKLAKKCGATEFSVAYPILYNKEKYTDPILFAWVDGQMFEIDMWE